MKKILMTLALCAVGALSAPAMAAGCEAVVESNDAMQFNVGSIIVPATCTEFKITLNHTGKMPATAMGHNVVISTTADMAAVARDGVKAGVASNYVPKGDARVVAATSLIGGGATTRITFPGRKLTAGTDYSFFCSFPGHSALMKGKLVVTR